MKISVYYRGSRLEAKCTIRMLHVLCPGWKFQNHDFIIIAWTFDWQNVKKDVGISSCQIFCMVRVGIFVMVLAVA